MTNRQQRSGLFVVGQFRTTGNDMIVLQTADEARELQYESYYFKTFRSRQAATKWRDYRPMNGFGNLAGLAVIPLPAQQDD